MQQDLKKEYDEYLANGSTKTFDSKYLAALDYLQLEEYSTPEDMYGFATLLDDTANWLTEMGMTWKPLTGIVGYTYPRWTSPAQGYEGQGYFNLFKETIEKHKYPVEIMTETPGEELIVEDGKTFNGFDVEEMLQNGQLYKADTLEDLAKQMGIDSEVFVATINKYNEAATNFNDEEFGRISFSKNSPIDEAPYYALPRVVARHITGGGLVRDDEYSVLNEKNEPIEGLYAGGEVTAGMSGISSFGDGMYIGRILFEK